MPNCSYCGGELGEAVIDRKDGTYSHYSSATCADSLKEQKAKLLLQNQELQNNLELATTQFQAWQKKSDQYRDERDAARTEAQKLHCEVQDASRDLDDMKISEAGWRRTAERAEADLEESNRLNDEYRRFVEQMVNTLNPDTAYHWLERARFSLKAMEKRSVSGQKCEKPFRPGENTEGRLYAMMACGRQQGHDGPCGCA